MKRWFALLGIVAAASLCACGGEDDGEVELAGTGGGAGSGTAGTGGQAGSAGTNAGVGGSAAECTLAEDCKVCCEEANPDAEAFARAANIECVCTTACPTECAEFCKDPETIAASPECETCKDAAKQEGGVCYTAVMQACATNPACTPFIECMKACPADA